MINVHGSLLPRWRGASPIIYSVLNEDAVTGLTIMKLRPKHFDIGEVIASPQIASSTKINPFLADFSTTRSRGAQKCADAWFVHGDGQWRCWPTSAMHTQFARIPSECETAERRECVVWWMGNTKSIAMQLSNCCGFSSAKSDWCHDQNQLDLDERQICFQSVSSTLLLQKSDNGVAQAQSQDYRNAKLW